jgi:ketosteroid isomerase-like protein
LRPVNIDNAWTLLDGLADLDFVGLMRRLEAGDESVSAEVAPLLELIDTEVAWDVSALGMPDMQVFNGHDGVIEFWLQWLAEWHTWSFEPSNFELLDEKDVFDVLVRARSRRMGAQLDWRQSQVMTFRGGKLVAYTVFNTRADALAADRGDRADART